MTHIEQIIDWFKSRGGSATLREILNSGQAWSHEFTARASNLRHKTRYDLVLTRGARPSDNTYCLIEKPYTQTEIAA
jgi:hypothetical protein